MQLEYYAAFKRKEILTDATTWMNLQNLMLSKISQLHKKTNPVAFHLREVLRVVKFVETESGALAARGNCLDIGLTSLLFYGKKTSDSYSRSCTGSL